AVGDRRHVGWFAPVGAPGEPHGGRLPGDDRRRLLDRERVPGIGRRGAASASLGGGGRDEREPERGTNRRAMPTPSGPPVHDGDATARAAAVKRISGVE